MPGALSATITARAPASCAFFTFTVKAQLPRSTTATLPATTAALASSSGRQANPRPSGWSITLASADAMNVRWSIGGPNSAVPIM
ncbi:MAG: hypothetical protein U1E90_07200 [Burkholderiaceae bacterium]